MDIWGLQLQRKAVGIGGKLIGFKVEQRAESVRLRSLRCRMRFLERAREPEFWAQRAY